jgi:hypothetical protein
MSAQAYIVVLKTPEGELIDWECLAKSPCKAVMAAHELMPGHEITKVSRQGVW